MPQQYDKRTLDNLDIQASSLLHPLSPLRLVPGLMCGWVAGEGAGGVDTEDRRLRPAECGYRDRDTGSQSTLRPRVQSIHSIHSYTGMLCSQKME